jgi:hypothetical protein
MHEHIGRGYKEAIPGMGASFNVVNPREDVFARLKSAARERDRIQDAEAERPVPTAPVDRHSKELQQLVNRVFVYPGSSAPRTVAFASINDESGSGSTCGRAAQLLAQQNAGPVCVLDGNSTRRSLTSFFFPNEVPGSNAKQDIAHELCIPIEDNLWLAGDWVFYNEAGKLLPLIQIQKHLETLAAVFHFLLIDTAALLHSEDALTFAQLAGTVVLIIEANVTLRREADTVVQSLQTQGVKILGAVLKNWARPGFGSLNRRIQS